MALGPNRLRRLCRDDRGVSSTELAVIMPVLMLLVLMPMQVGLWWHGKQAAEVAAEHAADAAAASAAPPEAAQQGATAILGQAGNLRNVTLHVSQNGDTVAVDITGELGFSLFPGGWTVRAHAEKPIERFIPEPDR